MFYDRTLHPAEIELLDDEFWSPEEELLAELKAGSHTDLLDDEN